MKTSMTLGIIAGALALVIGLIIIVSLSVAIYNNDNFDFEKYYREAYENNEHPGYYEETVAWQTAFLKFLRFLGFEVFAAGMLGLTGGLIAQKRRSMSRRFMTAGAVFSFLSLVGIVAGIVFVIAVVKLNRGDWGK